MFSHGRKLKTPLQLLCGISLLSVSLLMLCAGFYMTVALLSMLWTSWHILHVTADLSIFPTYVAYTVYCMSVDCNPAVEQMCHG